jgi:hypothetical protein
MKPLAIALSGVGEKDGEGNLTNVRCKAIGNWHNKFPLQLIYANKNEKNVNSSPQKE